MKKISLAIVMILVLSLVGCGGMHVGTKHDAGQKVLEATIKSANPSKVVFTLEDGSTVSGTEEDTCDECVDQEGRKVEITVDVVTYGSSDEVEYENARLNNFVD